MKKDPVAAINSADYQKYENPIPSREFITQVIATSAHPMHREDLLTTLKLHSDDQKEALRRRLRAMERDGQLLYAPTGFTLINPADIRTGVIIGHAQGFGFFKEAGIKNDLFVPQHQMRQLFDGDTVQARISGLNRQGREEVTIIKVVTRGVTQITGQLQCEGERYFILPDNSRIAHTIDIAPKDLNGAKPGQLVTAAILDYPSFKNTATAKIVDILGNKADPGIEIKMAISNHNIANKWPTDVLLAAAQYGQNVSEADKVHRIDLRKKTFVTIDGDDAKDFDDAVYCEPLKSGWRLYVAIADVSHYVHQNSELDTEAHSRGTSVYFPGQVVPMLPEALSNGLCSLNPHVDRLVMVCEMTITAKGKMTEHIFYEGVIHSHARLTYNQVDAFLNTPHTPLGEYLPQQYPAVAPAIINLANLYRVLINARATRGALDFESKEVTFEFNDQRKIAKIHPVIRNDAHRLIEECMLLANVATARFLESHQLPVLFRVHDGPKENKLASMREFLTSKGLTLGGGAKPKPKHYEQLLTKIDGRKDANAIRMVLLRSLGQARYSADNKGHFGLSYDAYTHFTSPIRRYPDLLVHRAIRSIIHHPTKIGSISKRIKKLLGFGYDDVRRATLPHTPSQQSQYRYNKNEMVDLAEHCSVLSRRADKASWDVEAALKCHYMQDKIGHEFSGIISTVTHFGLFIELDGTQIEGLIPINGLDNDYFNYDAPSQTLKAENSKRTYAIGDTLTVAIARVDMETHKIELAIAGTPKPQGATKNNTRNKRRK